jgi:hypothetical protein
VRHKLIERTVVCLAAGGGVGLSVLLGAPAALADPEPSPPTPVVAEEGTPHLASPDNLPPGTSEVPVGPPQGRTMSYLREIWHAMQTQDVSFNEALFLLTQRPLDPGTPPPAGLAPGPQPPAPAAPVVPPPAAPVAAPVAPAP